MVHMFVGHNSGLPMHEPLTKGMRMDKEFINKRRKRSWIIVTAFIINRWTVLPAALLDRLFFNSLAWLRINDEIVETEFN